MRSDIAIVRQHISKIDGVTRTWFEWSREKSGWAKTLVVEVDFDTDPNSREFRQPVLDAIVDTTKGVLDEETTMVVSYLKIVPRA
jgi:hypothetical protein